MTDQTELAPLDYDRGFEEGSMVACNVIISHLNRTGHADVAAEIHAAWEDGSIVPAETPTSVTVPSQVTPEIARAQGFTGSQCSNCNSMQMKVSGHCEVCSECGTTTGCS